MCNYDSNLANTNYSNKCLLISGANGSGKTLYAKQIAIIIFLAHIGSYVPADTCCVPLIDGIYCYNPNPSIFNEKCSVETELTDLNKILKSITRKSFVIID